MNTRFQIAIDGYSSTGKSTIAKGIAKELDILYVDTGAMYRAFTLFCLEELGENLSVVSSESIIQVIPKVEISLKGHDTFLNGTNVSSEIRTMRVASMVSQIATIKEVRAKMVADQQKMAESQSLVMDGRDIGSVVFPNAAVKFFIDADIEDRVERRYRELTLNGTAIDKDKLKSNLLERDKLDSERKIGPLKKMDDSVIYNTSGKSIEKQLIDILTITRSILNVC